MDHSHEMQNMPNMPGMTSYRLPLPASPGQPLSEFNHHMAGVMLIILAVCAMLYIAKPGRYRYLGYVWPAVMLVYGLYLILYSDPEAWPTSYVSLSRSLGDQQVLQHKIFALLLVIMGTVELSRISGLMRGHVWKYSFPALGSIGILMLLWHQFGGGHSEHMAEHGAMTLIMYQHALYVVLGVAGLVSVALFNTRPVGVRFARFLGPEFLLLLGIALAVYRE